MIMGFSTILDGKPTLFVEKIWAGLLQMDNELYSDYLHPDGKPSQMKTASEYREFTPKIHTIRIDINNRWKKGNEIDFFINVRKSNMFRFAPRIPVVSIQRIFITVDNGLEISISGRQLSNSELKDLAINDGFENVADFETYFQQIILKTEDQCFSGKIIHWTDKSY